MVSSTTGDNLEQLQSFLNSIPLTQLTSEQEDKNHQQLPEFQVNKCLYVATYEPYSLLMKQVDILISKNQALQILYLTHRVYNETTY